MWGLAREGRWERDKENGKERGRGERVEERGGWGEREGKKWGVRGIGGDCVGENVQIYSPLSAGAGAGGGGLLAAAEGGAAPLDSPHSIGWAHASRCARRVRRRCCARHSLASVRCVYCPRVSSCAIVQVLREGLATTLSSSVLCGLLTTRAPLPPCFSTLLLLALAQFWSSWSNRLGKQPPRISR